MCQNRTMKYVLGIIGIIIFIFAYNDNKEKKAERLKKEITCIEFLNVNSVECLESPFVYLSKISKKEAEKKLVSYKKDIERFNTELNQFFLAGREIYLYLNPAESIKIYVKQKPPHQKDRFSHRKKPHINNF